MTAKKIISDIRYFLNTVIIDLQVLFSDRKPFFKRLFSRTRVVLLIAVIAVLLFSVLALTASPKRSNWVPPNAGFVINSDYLDMNRDQIIAFQRAALKFNELPGFEVRLHTVQLGENYWALAMKHGVRIDTVYGFNPYLRDLWAVHLEQLLLPNKLGTLHLVQDNEKLTNIAEFYELTVNDIAEANHLNEVKRNKKIIPGDLLFIPGVMPKRVTEKMAYRYELRNRFCSPTAGAYTSPFGVRFHPILHEYRMHKGLDIRVYTGQGICASASGVVTVAGWVGGYGKYIKIRHADGWETGYGHLSRIGVRVGQHVTKGQWIGAGGSTGRSTGPHLDFTVIHNGKYLDPAQFIW